MSGFDLTNLLPYYLDETDEQIAALNDALLKLEQDPSDAAVLREAFRMIHSIKGSSTVMGFDQVKDLTHHLETYFDWLRSGKRTLDRAMLELSFRCLDGLRDFHRQLRSGDTGSVDLSGLTAEVIASLSGTPSPAAQPAAAPVQVSEPKPEPVQQTRPTVEQATGSAQPAAAEVAETPLDEPATARLNLVFVPNLPWPDMKAKLVLNRLSAKARVVRTEPTAEQLETIEKLPSFQVWLATDSSADELRALADVEGVQKVEYEPLLEVPPGGALGAEKHQAVSLAEPEPVFAEVAATEDVVKDRAAESFQAVEPEKAKPQAVEPKPAPSATAASATTGSKRVAETLRVDVDRLDSLMNLAGELVINRARFHEIAQGLEELFRNSNARLLTEETQDRLDVLGRELDSIAGSNATRGDTAASLERVGLQFRRLSDTFNEIRRELELIRHGREQVNALADAIHQLGRVTDGLQKGVLETRMVPIGPLFERFHRVIRDLRVSSGKEVVLEIAGEKTELDKRMIDELGDPLIHMVRNSVDHGLEPPDLREKLGKPRAGTVALQAMHRGNSVVITVSDDGRGIDPRRIQRKVVEKGLVTADEAERLSDRQLIQYIWHPGLSTAEQVTDISGRGVGMDIVKSRIESLNGTVDVRTEQGAGTTFTIRLPLTLAILPCLLFRIQEEVYAIPIDHIDEIVEVDERQIFVVRERRMIEIRKRLVSLIALDDILTWSRRPRLARVREVSNGKVTAVVTQNGDTTIGLIVDQLLGMQEVVLKSLEKNFRPVPSLSGASILGDGRVSLILDVDALINMVAHRDTALEAAGVSVPGLG